MKNAVATATFNDTWAGEIPAFLVPQKTSRNGERVTVYRWLTERGSSCDGLAHGHGREFMLTLASRRPSFSNVKPL